MIDKKLKGMPLGIENFKELIDSNSYFVDKTMMLKELIDDTSKVKLFTRPRRFGKVYMLFSAMQKVRGFPVNIDLISKQELESISDGVLLFLLCML